MGALQVVLITLGVLGGIVVAVPAGYYLTDGAVEAVVIKRPSCGLIPIGGNGKVTIQTTMPVPGVEHTLEIPKDKCNMLAKDNYVRHTLRTERTSLWTKDPDDGGRCIWDTNGGANGCPQ